MEIRGPGDTTVSDPGWMTAFRVNARVAGRHRVGRAFVAGDAAHIHSPVGGQGLNTERPGCAQPRLEARPRPGRRSRRVIARHLRRRTGTRRPVGDQDDERSHAHAHVGQRRGAARAGTSSCRWSGTSMPSPARSPHRTRRSRQLPPQPDRRRVPRWRISASMRFAGGPRPGDRAPDVRPLVLPGQRRRPLLRPDPERDVAHAAAVRGRRPSEATRQDARRDRRGGGGARTRPPARVRRGGRGEAKAGSAIPTGCCTSATTRRCPASS